MANKTGKKLKKWNVEVRTRFDEHTFQQFVHQKFAELIRGSASVLSVLFDFIRLMPGLLVSSAGIGSRLPDMILAANFCAEPEVMKWARIQATFV